MNTTGNEVTATKQTDDSNVKVFDSDPKLIKQLRGSLVEGSFDQDSLKGVELNPFKVTTSA